MTSNEMKDRNVSLDLESGALKCSAEKNFEEILQCLIKGSAQ